MQLNRTRSLLMQATQKHRGLFFKAAQVMLWFRSRFCDCVGVKTLSCRQRDKQRPVCVLFHTQPHRDMKNFTGARFDSKALNWAFGKVIRKKFMHLINNLFHVQQIEPTEKKI